MPAAHERAALISSTSIQPSDGASPLTSPRLYLHASGLAVATITLLAYLPTLSSDFVRLDDYQYVVDNELVRDPSWEGVLRFFAEVTHPSTVEGYYQPLTMLSLMLDSMLAGSPVDPIEPFVFHLTNVLLHAVTSVLVLMVLQRIFGGLTVPIVFALIFALHPVQVESVAWISQRKTVLATALAAGSILAFLAASSSSVSDRTANTQQRRRMAIAFVLYVLANLAKPTVMLLPLVFLLLDYWPLQRIGRHEGRNLWSDVRTCLPEKLPFLLAMILFGYTAAVSQTSAGQGAGMAVAQITSLDLLCRWIGLLCYNLMLYARCIVLPVNLSPFRDVPADLSFSNPAVSLSIAGTLVVLAVTLLSVRRRPAVFVGLAASAILLSLALGPVRFMASLVADRFLYLPLLFLLLPAAELIASAERRFPARGALVRAAAAVWLLPLLVLTRSQQEVWNNSKALWTRVESTAPSLDQAPNNLAYLALEEGRPKEAVAYAQRALALNPSNSSSLHALGRAYVRTRQPELALPVLEQALTIGLGPITGSGYVAKAEALICLGQDAAAEAACRSAIEYGFSAGACYAAVADAALRWARDYDRAAAYFGRAIEAEPENLTYRWNRGTALEAAGRRAEALVEYEEVRRRYQAADVAFPPELAEAMDRLRQQLEADGG